MKNSQLLEPLFEFSGACSGCGETPYLKLLTQLFGDRLVVANATGCSSIYGGNLPTTPWSTNRDGLGPAWSNSLFEDNAEFGLGMRLGIEQHERDARRLVEELAEMIGAELAAELLANTQPTEADIGRQRDRVRQLRAAARPRRRPIVPDTSRSIADELVRTSTWIVGGDGWAYDIGFGGVDHVLGSGRNVNLLVLDTEVYSNTGGQASKATPLGAVAKFATAGKGHREEGSRCGRAAVRQRLRRADRDRRQRDPDGQGVAGGRCVGRAVARDRLFDLHRARHRHDDLDGAPEGCRQVRLLAAVPLQADRRRSTSTRSSSTRRRRAFRCGTSR